MLKAYRRDLEREGLMRSWPGAGTFVTRTLPPSSTPPRRQQFLASMADWLRAALLAGLGPDDIEAIYRTAVRNCFAEGVA